MATAATTYGSHTEAMQDYFAEGEARALALGNRGPLRFGPDGKLDPGIVEAYERVGFYVFEQAHRAGRAGRARGQLPRGVRAPAERARIPRSIAWAARRWGRNANCRWSTGPGR